MEKHKCKLCFRSFSNGRALGGHMRSHMMNLTVPPKPEPSSPPPTIQLSFEAESASSSSSSEEEDNKGLSYGLRENPRRSIRLVDPEFSFAVETGSGSVILQDRESETESSKNPTRRRSKRAWKLGALVDKYQIQNQEQESIKKMKLSKPNNKTELWVEPEPVSSVSDATTEEDVAFCLMMLSRDKWKKQKEKDPYQLQEELQYEEQEEEEDEEGEDDDETERSLEESDESEHVKSSSKNRIRGRYKCETCSKVFRSYQALGGHRASHKKIKVAITVDEPELGQGNGGASVPIVEKKIHECPVCFRVFASGQALGGHKRTHVTGPSATATAATIPERNSIKFGENLIDLNLPAPIDDDDVSQIENSAVSDAEFVKSYRQ